MQFDWMVQCYPGDGVFRDAPLLERLDRERTMAGVDACAEAGLEGLWAPDHFILGPRKEEYEVRTLLGALAERTDDVERSWLAHVLVREDEAEIDEYCDRIFPLPWGEESDVDEQLSDREDATEKGDFIIGTPAEVVERIEGIRELGSRSSR